MKKINLASIVSIIFLVTYLSGADVWKYEEIAGSRTFDWMGRNAIALDSSGKAHICYYQNYNGSLYHCWQTSSGWDFESVEGMPVCGGGSIAVDSADNNVILRGDKCARGNNGVYSIEDITESIDSDELINKDVIIDSTGAIHAIYSVSYIFSDYLYYATNKSGTWQLEEVLESEEYTGSASIALDSSNKPHISVLVSDGADFYLEHYWYNGSCWQNQQIKQNGNYSASYTATDICIDDSDKIFIAYTDFNDANETWMINYTDNTTGTWRDQVVITDSNGSYRYLIPRLTVDPCGVVHTIYKRGHYQLYHSYGQWNNWTAEKVTDCNYIENISLAADANGLMHIAFLESISGFKKLSYARGSADSWQISEIDRKTRMRGYSWIDLDNNDTPNVLYYESWYDQIFLAQRLGDDNWDLDPVPNSRDLCCPLSYNSGNLRMDMDVNGAAHITYQGCSENDPYYDGIGYLTNASGTWVEDYNVVRFAHLPEIAVNNSGQVRRPTYTNAYDYAMAIYYDVFTPTGQLETKLLDTALDMNGVCLESGVWMDMECDNWGGYHIVYVFGGDNGRKSSRYDIKYGYSLPDSSFTTEIIAENIASNSWDSKNPMLAVDNSGNVHIVWADVTEDVIKYVTNATGSWQFEDVNVPGRTLNRNLDIAVDSSGHPFVVLVPYGDDAMILASKIAGVWQFENVSANLEFDDIEKPSIQIDSNDKVHLSFRYYNNFYHGFYYATNAVVAPVISVEPNSIYFYAHEGGTYNETVNIRNNGSGDLYVSSIDIFGPDADKFSVSSSPFTLPPGGLAVRTVSFSSATKGIYEATLQINSDDNQKSSINIPMASNCIGPPTGSLYTKYSFYDFNDVILGQSSDSVTVRIQNQATYTMNIGYYISDGNNFRCTRPVPVTLPGGESLYIDVWFEPNDLGRSDCVLYVSGSSGMYTSSLEVAFTGVGVPVPVAGISVEADVNQLEAILPDGEQMINIKVINIGDANLIISDLQTSNTSEFTTDPNAGPNPLGRTPPFTLLPGEKRSMVMQFSTSTLGQYANEIDITSNAPEKHTITTFTGNAVSWNKCDFDLDKIVDFKDFAVLAEDWLLKPDVNPYPGDVAPEEPDGVVNRFDLKYFADQWLLTKDIF